MHPNPQNNTSIQTRRWSPKANSDPVAAFLVNIGDEWRAVAAVLKHGGGYYIAMSEDPDIGSEYIEDILGLRHLDTQPIPLSFYLYDSFIQYVDGFRINLETSDEILLLCEIVREIIRARVGREVRLELFERFKVPKDLVEIEVERDEGS